MKPLFYSILVLLLVGFAACRDKVANSSPANTIILSRDTTISLPHEATSDLVLDSITVSEWSAQSPQKAFANAIVSFYNRRNYQYAWFTAEGPTQAAFSFQQAANSQIAALGDSSLFPMSLDSALQNLAAASLPLPTEQRQALELQLTFQFFYYANKIYKGNEQLDLNQLHWYIPRKKLDIATVIDSIVQQKNPTFSSLEPLSKQYFALSGYLARLQKVKELNKVAPFVLDRKKYTVGDSGTLVQKLKLRLRYMNDYTDKDSSIQFTPALQEAVKQYQIRHGLTPDGVLGEAMVRELNLTIDQRIKTILLNLERLRWLPAIDTAQTYLSVNIPEFKLHVIEKGKITKSMNVVVGSTQHNTVIFSGLLKHVVFNPYWNVPYSIYKNEIAPGMRRNRNYLARHNMEIYAYNGNTPQVRQKPGKSNALGRVKFLFPNSYSIYFHDTPAKSLFGENKRAFSHGCIRLGEPLWLAEFLLKDQPQWNAEKIAVEITKDKEKWVNVSQPVPVIITYLTAWVDVEGRLNFRDDIYGRDKKLAAQLFTAQ